MQIVSTGTNTTLKYLTPLIVLLLIGGTAYATYLMFPQTVGQTFDECCEYLGLLSPEGVSEVPGQEHVSFEKAGDGRLPAGTPGLGIGANPGTVNLPGLDGREHSIDFAAADVTAVVWVSSFCPTSKIYEERLNKLQADFAGRVQFYGICSSAMESVAELRAHFEDGDPNRLRMTVLKDEGNVIADRFGARVSMEIFLFDRQGKLHYRGGVDDARNPQRVEVEYARRAISRILRGESPEWEYQPANGCCPIDRVESPTAPVAQAAPEIK